MKNVARMVLVLGLVCSIAAISLALVYDVTKGPIQEAKEKELRDALEVVLPAFDNMPDKDLLQVEGVKFPYYIARKEGKITGVAFKSSTNEGFAGPIVVLVGADAEGVVNGMRILEHTETPGLGAKYTDEIHTSKFDGKSLDNTLWKVDKEGGEFISITGATITMRAMVIAVEEGLKGYKENREAVLAAKAPEPAPVTTPEAATEGGDK